MLTLKKNFHDINNYFEKTRKKHHIHSKNRKKTKKKASFEELEKYCSGRIWLRIKPEIGKMDHLIQKLKSYNNVQIIEISPEKYSILVKIVSNSEREMWDFVNQKIKAKSKKKKLKK